MDESERLAHAGTDRTAGLRGLELRGDLGLLLSAPRSLLLRGTFPTLDQLRDASLKLLHLGLGLTLFRAQSATDRQDRDESADRDPTHRVLLNR